MARQDLGQYIGIPTAFVNDFNNGLSPAECGIKMNNIYEDAGVIFVHPHIVNDVDGFDTTDGAFHLRQLARARGDRPMVLTGVVDPGVGTTRRGVVVETEVQHTYIAPDNGLLGAALAEEVITDVHEIRSEIFDAASNTFHGRDVFIPLAARIATGEKPADMTDVLIPEPLDPKGLTLVIFEPNMVVHVDGYGGDEYAKRYGGNVKFEWDGIPRDDAAGEKAIAARLTLPRRSNGIPRRHLTIPVKETFGQAGNLEPLLYEGSSSGGVELAINHGKGDRSAAGRFNLHVGDRVGFDWKYATQNGARGSKRR